jgi:hypothetical protein
VPRDEAAAHALSWHEVLAAFVVAHVVGDFLLQTDWQARHKRNGAPADPVALRALAAHGATYTLAFVPALAWIASERSVAGAVGIGALVTLPHLYVDDGRVVTAWLRRVKRCREPFAPGLQVSVDQSMHVVCLFAVALLAAA